MKDSEIFVCCLVCKVSLALKIEKYSISELIQVVQSVKVLGGREIVVLVFCLCLKNKLEMDLSHRFLS